MNALRAVQLIVTFLVSVALSPCAVAATRFAAGTAPAAAGRTTCAESPSAKSGSNQEWRFKYDASAHLRLPAAEKRPSEHPDDRFSRNAHDHDRGESVLVILRA
jgi:hypothetical protein